MGGHSGWAAYTVPCQRSRSRIPVEDAEQMTSDTTTFTVKATGKFKRPIAYNYYSDDSDDQNVTFLQLLVDSDSLSDTASAVLTLEKTAIEIYKTDSESGNGVAGATYGVYTDEDCTDLVASLGPTDASGYAAVEFVKRQDTYYVKETTASTCYLVSTETNKVSVVLTETSTIYTTEDQARGQITVSKEDAETGEFSSLGSAALKGAVYGLYAAEDIEHPDGTTGTLYEAGDLVQSLTFDDSGTITFENLYFGSYYVKEISAPVGYTIDETKYPVTLTYADQETAVVLEELTVYEQVIRGDLAFTKANQSTQERLADVVFLITSETTGESHVVVTDENGCVNTASSKNAHKDNTNANDAAVTADENGNYVVDESLLDSSAGIWFGLTEDGRMTDADDSLGALPYDTYTITELSCSANEGLQLVELTFTIAQDGVTIDFGTIDDPLLPQISTTAVDEETNTHYSAANDSVVIIDTVSYSGLTSGETHTLYGKLMDRETGAALLDAKGNEITAQTTFTASSTCGSVTVEFSFDATGMEGITTVVFETLYDSDGEWVASHEDLEDEGQTVRLAAPPDAVTTTETASSSSAVKTGDTNKLVRWIAAAVIAAGAACSCVAIRRRRKKKHRK